MKSIEEKVLCSASESLESFMVVEIFKWNIKQWIQQVWRAVYSEDFCKDMEAADAFGLQ